MRADETFFEVTKRLHNAFQGQTDGWVPSEFQTYWEGVAGNSRVIGERLDDYDVVVVHDPQPLVLRTLHPGADTRWVWRCHIDLTQPHRDAWDALAPHLAGYDLLVFSAPEYVPDDLVAERVATALPCIDPHRSKNRRIDASEIVRVLKRYRVDPSRPYLLQVSRYDPWKDPVGVVETYRRVKARHPEVQLVYMAAMADDDPEAERVLARTREAAGDDPDIRLLALRVPPEEVHDNALEVNAMQRGAAVVLQKSLREGFGLTVAEALWKEKPVVGGDVGGIRHQITDGENGLLVGSVEEAAAACIRILEEPGLGDRLGAEGRLTVSRRFLFPRLLLQYVEWLAALSRPRRSAPPPRG